MTIFIMKFIVYWGEKKEARLHFPQTFKWLQEPRFHYFNGPEFVFCVGILNNMKEGMGSSLPHSLCKLYKFMWSIRTTTIKTS